MGDASDIPSAGDNKEDVDDDEKHMRMMMKLKNIWVMMRVKPQHSSY